MIIIIIDNNMDYMARRKETILSRETPAVTKSSDMQSPLADGPRYYLKSLGGGHQTKITGVGDSVFAHIHGHFS